MATIDELKWSTLTATVNEMKSPNQFVRRLIFGETEAVPTETIEIGVFTKSRQVAPFVRKDSEALLVEGHGETFQTVEAPNVRMKRAFRPSPLLFNRRPGTVIFSPGAGAQVSALQAHIARDMQVLADYATNAEEYLCALALQGVITYQVSPEANFTITFPKPAGNNITLSTFWDNADSTLPRPAKDFHTAKRVISDEVGLPTTDCILGKEAADAFIELAEAGQLKGFLDVRRIEAGFVTLQEQFRDDGAILLGAFSGVTVWEYSRTATLAADGTTVNLIRPKYAEFVARNPAADFRLYYGAIADLDALEGELFQAPRFSKSWRTPDPSQQLALLHTRPLPVPRRPGAMVSMKVVSG